MIADTTHREVLSRSVLSPISDKKGHSAAIGAVNNDHNSIRVVDTYADDLSLHISTDIRNGRSRAMSSHFVLYYFAHGSTPSRSSLPEEVLSDVDEA